jgi:hypothetical protein
MERTGLPALYSDEGKIADSYIDQAFGQTRELAARFHVGHTDGMAAGIAAAEDVPLNQQIQSEKMKEIGDGRG